MTRQVLPGERLSDFLEEKKDPEGGSVLLDNLSLLSNPRTKESAALRQRRGLQSLARFQELPATSAELRRFSKRQGRKRAPRKDRDGAHGTWGEALRPFIEAQRSQEVRADRLFKAVLSSPQLLLGYLEAGVNVNLQNAYGQTPLYVACWKGAPMAVHCLLEYGANATVAAHGGSTCYSVAKRYHRHEILQLLKLYEENGEDGFDMTQIINGSLALSAGNICQVSMLIDPMANHPGAGACIVDNALSETQVQQLEELWRVLPIAESHDDVAAPEAKCPEAGKIATETSLLRPSRSYFCDAEGRVQTMLEGCIQAVQTAVATSSSCPNTQPVPPLSVFSHLRFLNYAESGGVLPPHVDLCRVDAESGQRSTHTLILYLTDCEQGGGTALLQCLKNPKVLVVSRPKRGRALLFPHACPHSGLEVISAPKLLLRGEVVL